MKLIYLLGSPVVLTPIHNIPFTWHKIQYLRVSFLREPEQDDSNARRDVDHSLRADVSYFA